MFQDLNIFNMASAMAVHAGKRQALLAQNMANADTPGYRARDLAPFSEIAGKKGPETAMRATRAGHNDRAAGLGQGAEITTKTEISPNGNGVSIETEMLKAVDVQRQHSRALAIYKSSLTILRTSVRGR